MNLFTRNSFSPSLRRLSIFLMAVYLKIWKIAWHGLSLMGAFKQTFPTKLISELLNLYEQVESFPHYLYKCDTWFQVKPNKKEVILYLKYARFFSFLSSPSLQPPKKEIHRTDVELSLYTYKMQPVYCVVLVLGKEKFTIFPRMCALAMKLKSQIKSKDYVELKKKEPGNNPISVSNSERWCRRSCDTQKASQRVLGFSQSLPCSCYFPKAPSTHTGQTLCQRRNTPLSATFIPTCYIYSFLDKKWHIEYVFLEIPAIHSLGFQLVSQAPPHPNPANPGPRCATTKHLQIQYPDKGKALRPGLHGGQSSASPPCPLSTHKKPSLWTRASPKFLLPSEGPGPLPSFMSRSSGWNWHTLVPGTGLRSGQVGGRSFKQAGHRWQLPPWPCPAAWKTRSRSKGMQWRFDSSRAAMHSAHCAYPRKRGRKSPGKASNLGQFLIELELFKNANYFFFFFWPPGIWFEPPRQQHCARPGI